MANPWMKKNPFMSMWLSTANRVAGTLRGLGACAKGQTKTQALTIAADVKRFTHSVQRLPITCWRVSYVHEPNEQASCWTPTAHTAARCESAALKRGSGAASRTRRIDRPQC